MTEETAVYMAAPDVNGKPTLLRRGGSKGFMPSTWLNRTLRIEYLGGVEGLRETTATLLDVYPAGPILNIAGGKTLLCWERLVLCELVED